jgi:hypothetical protein
MSERVKPWGPNEAELQADLLEESITDGHVSIDLIEDEERTVATLRAHAAALRLLEADPPPDPVLANDRLPFRKGYRMCLAAFAKALRGEEGER